MNPDDAVNPFQGLLGDLMKVVGSARMGTPWLDAARALAQGVATDGLEEVNADPIARMEIESLARIAELHVANATGVPLGTPTHRVELQTVGRGTWALQSLDDWAPWLERMVAANPSGGPLPVSDTDDLLQQLASTMGPVFAGMQFGSAIGHLAQRALGHFELPIPRPGTTISLVPENIARFAEDWSLAIDQARLWVCVRELTAYTVLSRPTVVERIGTLLDRATSEAADTSRDLASRLSDLGPDPQDLERILADPEALLADLLAPDRQFGSEQLVVATTAIGAYVDYITTQVAGRLLGSTATLSEAWFRYRTADTANARGAAVLFGLDLSKERVEQGASFVRGVVERAGDDGLARLWETAASLPTPAELLAPGLWLERIDLARAE